MMPSLNQSILSHIMHELKEGNVRYCEALGFDRDELSELNTLGFDEILYLSNAATHFLKISVNHDVFRKMMAQVRQEQQFQNIINQAMSLGGSIALINHYFGLSSAEISARRRLLGINIRQGRKQIPGEEQEANAWKRWQELDIENLDSIEALKAMMKLSKEQSLSLTVVWNLIKQWEEI